MEQRSRIREFIGTLLASRRRVLLTALAALALLDLGRSIFAHLGYAIPWSSSGSPIRSATRTSHGRPVSIRGEPTTRRGHLQAALRGVPWADGRGNGPAAPSLIPRPRDFTTGLYKYKTTPADEPPSEEDLLHTVSQGLRASAMPYFHDLLSAADLREVVGYIKHFSSAFDSAAVQPLVVPKRVAPSADSIDRGARLLKRAVVTAVMRRTDEGVWRSRTRRAIP